MGFIAGKGGFEQGDLGFVRLGIALLDGGGASGDGGGVGVDFRGEIRGVFRMDAFLQALIEDKRIAQVVDGGLERAALLGIGVRGEFPLLIDFLQMRLEFGIGAIFLIGLRHAEHAQDFLVGDGKHRIGVSHRGIEQHIGQPARGLHFVAVGEAQRLFAAQDEQ